MGLQWLSLLLVQFPFQRLCWLSLICAESCLLGADVLHGQGFSICLGNEPCLVHGGNRVPFNGFGSPGVQCGSAGDNLGSRWTSVSWLFLLVSMCLVCSAEILSFCFSFSRALRCIHVFRLTIVFIFVLVFAYQCYQAEVNVLLACPNTTSTQARPPGKPPDFLSVNLLTTVSVPPWTQKLVQGSVSRAPGVVGMIEPLEFQDNGCHVPFSVATVSAEFSVPILLSNFNFSACDVSVESGTCVAHFVAVHDTLPEVVAAGTEVEGMASDDSAISSRFDWSNFAGTADQHHKLVSVLCKYSDVVAHDDGDVGLTTVLSHEIQTGDARPIRQGPRRLAPVKNEIVSQQISSMLANDIIEPSVSPWASPIVLVRKTDGTYRFCVDYRRLNGVTHQDAFPLPRIDDTLDNLGGACYFSTLDLQSGYWQVPVKSSDCEKTAFVTSSGLYQFKRMPFGLTNAPATFQRLMNAVLRGLTPVQCLVYLDDIIIFSVTFEEHLVRLQSVLAALRAANLKIKPRKCRLLCSQVRFLGHIVSGDGIATDPAKVQAVREWPVPKSVKALKSFLGFASYYRRFIRDFAKISSSLHALLEKDAAFVWLPKHQDAFDKLRLTFCTAPVLAFPDFAKPFVLDTDACTSGLGAVLSQVGNDGLEHPVAYISRSLTKSERNYNITRLELLAVVWACRTLRPYLLLHSFLLRTDHGSLRWLMNFNNPTGQVARWLDLLAEFDFSVEHRVGRKHGNADGLSRQCDPEAAAVHAVVFPSSFNQDEVRTAVAADPDLCVVLDRLETSKPVEPGDSDVVRTLLHQRDVLVVESGVLFRDSNPISHARQLVVPRAFRERLLTEAHAGVTSGHFGQARTLGRLRSHYYWPGMSVDVNVFCRKCSTCAQSKDPPRKSKAPMGTIRASAPFSVMAMDIMGPFPVTSRGFRYILVVGDYFSKWLELIPLMQMTAD